MRGNGGLWLAPGLRGPSCVKLWPDSLSVVALGFPCRVQSLSIREHHRRFGRCSRTAADGNRLARLWLRGVTFCCGRFFLLLLCLSVQQFDFAFKLRETADLGRRVLREGQKCLH